MDPILETLKPDQVVLDLGCGGGSFRYALYKCKILGVDRTLDPGSLFSEPARVFYTRADSHALPLNSGSVDFAVCNHSMEHVVRFQETLAELARVLKRDGHLWISIPNGFGFDDGLYRFLYDGGGHVNRFTFAGLKTAVESTGMQMLQFNTLTSSFIYCRRPPDTAWPYLPRRAKVLHSIGILPPVAFALNILCRMLDRSLHSTISQYGWGFLFTKGPADATYALPSYFNVCAGCGAGHGRKTLRAAAYRRWGLFAFYRCPRCNEPNMLFEPPAGFD